MTTAIASAAESVADEARLIRRAEPVMGTVASFHVRPGEAPPGDVYLALAEARRRLHRADATFSTWKPLSPVSRLRRGEIELAATPPEVALVLRRCAEARLRSGGWFDPWAAPGGLDPTGLVKGWAAMKALDALIDSGVAGAMVSAGGDAALHGERQPGRPWRIGIQNPFDGATLAAVASPPAPATPASPPVRAAGIGGGWTIATSGSYERGAHIYDPFTGRPADAVRSATVTGPALDLADAMATALVAGGKRALPYLGALDGYEALIIDHDGAVTSTPGFPHAA